MDLALIISGATLLLNIVIVAFWKPWLSAYGGEKGKNLARKEDLTEILSEVRAVTITQKGIELKLSGDLWQRQMQWNETRTVYGNLVAVLHELQAACSDMGAKIKILAEGQLSLAQQQLMRQKFNESMAIYATQEKELIKLRALAEIFAGPKCKASLDEFFSKRPPTDFDSYDDWSHLMMRLIELNGAILHWAKYDLGIKANLAARS